MDKRLKKTVLLSFCVLLALLLLACNKEPSVEGQWQAIGRSDMMKLLGAEEETWTFAEDGTASQYWDKELINSGAYTSENGIVTVKFFTGDSLTFELDGNELLQNSVAYMVRMGEE